jgi:predicted Fe-Mo cluster-binding NifX family protein
MKIGITVDDSGLEGTVSQKFADCKFLMIVTIEDHLVGESSTIRDAKTIENKLGNPEFNLAQELIDHDCEAVITGELNPVEFDLIADACITRYHGAGYSACIALDQMEKRELCMIRNLEGTNGCDESHHMH